MKTVLMVAEKPSLAQSIAKILSKGGASSRKGLNGACSVHEYTGSFMGQSVRFKMTSVCGHVMSLDFIGKYNNWDKVDPAELFSKAPTEKKEANPKLSMVKFLQVEGRGCDYVVLWLDCDKEGENICFEVLDAVLPVMNRMPAGERTVYRAKFSSITDTDIMNAMNKLGEPNKNEALSVDARQELDLRIGCAFTRFQTKYFQGKYGNLDSSLISFGPCQTPTLGFCVERHDKIQSFKPEPYWVLQVKVSRGQEHPLTLDWDRVRVFDREIAQMFLNLTKTSREAKVESVSKKEKAKQRPQALNTVEMLRVASSALGMGPQHTMQIAERLYTQGYISYPRTETTHYPENFDLRGTLRQQANNSFWGDTVKALLAENINRPRKGTDAGDHPPITPMRSATEAELGGDAWRLYEYITRHFIATISYDCKYLQTTISFSVGCERFTSTCKEVISPGFTEIMPWLGIPKEETFQPCERGDKFTVDEIKLLEKQTCPPDYLTEAELITLMEKHGIGTDASIPVHINNICQRNYVTVESGRRLKPTSLGIVLVHGYYKIDSELVLPTIRSAVEKQLNLISLGKVNFHQVPEQPKSRERRAAGQKKSAMQPRGSLLSTFLTFWAFLRVEGELCETNICLNGGTCFVSSSKEPFCICPDGFTGTDCNMTEKGPCQPNPCHNNGECQELSHTRRGDTFAQYSCKCLPGYFGENCENSENHCSSYPCKNGGVCHNLVNDYSCKCVSPFIGKGCQTRCANPLGMEGGAISDAQITSSSLYHGFLGLQRWGPNLARLNNKGLVNAWTASSYDKHPWIQVNLLRQLRVSGIITQGASRMGKAEYLKEFKVAYSVDGHDFTFYKAEGQNKDKIFHGNLDNDGRKANIFSPPITAQYIRVYPVTCHRACTLRLELFGCEMSGCSDPLGLKSHLISDKQMTASSVFKTWGIDAFTWHPHYARLDKIGKTNGWTAAENNQSEWLQIDLGVPKKITGIITQGAKDFGNIQYVEAFKIAYSANGSTWIVYQDSRTKTDKVFLGNTDNYSHKRNLFSPPFSARYVRILPQSWHERITLRMELLGCNN